MLWSCSFLNISFQLQIFQNFIVGCRSTVGKNEWVGFYKIGGVGYLYNTLVDLFLNIFLPAEFVCFYALLNYYIYTMAFVYSPSKQLSDGKFLQSSGYNFVNVKLICFVDMSKLTDNDRTPF